MELADLVYDLTEHFPARERFGLSYQMHKAAVSVPSNIAEGHRRRRRVTVIIWKLRSARTGNWTLNQSWPSADNSSSVLIAPGSTLCSTKSGASRTASLGRSSPIPLMPDR
jgi:hypothetical protein